MQALAPERVGYAGTASKTLAPGLRLAWLVLPPAWWTTSSRPSGWPTRLTGALDQLALADLIDSGGYDRHIRRCRLVYRRRRDRLVAALARRAPDVTVAGLAAGLHALVELPQRRGEADAAERRPEQRRCCGRAFGVSPLTPPETRSALVVGYATPPEHAFTTALARLCAALAA